MLRKGASWFAAAVWVITAGRMVAARAARDAAGTRSVRRKEGWRVSWRSRGGSEAESGVVCAWYDGSSTKMIDIMSKFNVGQPVYLFNSVSGKIEKDVVYGILYVPRKGDAPISAEDLSKGDYEVCEQYQTLQHQILDAGVLFDTEADCRAFYRNYFSD